MISGRITWFCGILEGRARCREARGVRRVNVATAGEVVRPRFFVRLDRNRLILDLVGPEEVGQVQLGRGAGLNADRCAVELLGALHAQLLGNHEALAVIVVGALECELDVDVAHECPGGVAEDHVTFTGIQDGEARLAGCRLVFDLVRVAKDRRGDGTAVIDVEALPLATLRP